MELVHNIKVDHRSAVAKLEASMLQLPQAECPVKHYFGPGVYIREVTIPADTLAIGHEQRFEHVNILLKGIVILVGDDGELIELRAPMTYVGKPGRKTGYVVEETVWQNVYATSLRDVMKLEEMFLIKSDSFEANALELQRLRLAARLDEREDFKLLLEQSGFTAEEVTAMSENPNDQMPMPPNLGEKVGIFPSPIHGHGVFLTSPVVEGEIIAPARLGRYRTPVGRYTNHSPTPNAKFVGFETGDIYLVASRAIDGCRGGQLGEEVTVDYRQALKLSGILIGEQK